MTSPADSAKPIVAWTVRIDGMCCVAFAPTKPKAQWVAVRAYREAGYGLAGSWPSTITRRAECYDRCTLRHLKQKAWAEEHVWSYPKD